LKAKVRMTIGQVAKLANVSVETIRFYEREGMISQPKRQSGSYREYSRDTVKRIHFIKRANGMSVCWICLA